jgi:16S rRNA (guanine527-N7)-methyltransferase
MSLLPLPHDPLTIVLEGSRLLGVALEQSAAERMLSHLRLVEEWGKRKNLTSLKTRREMAVFHLLDSITVLKVLPEGQGKRLADIGTGAGFPGLVLKSVRMDLHLALIDRDPGKIVFLKHVVRHLGLSEVIFLNARVETLVGAPSQEPFDMVVTRALSSDPAFFSSLLPLVTISGSFIRMAGPSSSARQIDLPDFRLVDRWDGALPFSTSSRTVCRYVRIR